MSRAPLVRLASTTSLSLPAERFITTYRLGWGPGSARMPDMMSRAAWSSSSTEVDVELSQRFWAWVVRFSDSYVAVATRSLSRLLEIARAARRPRIDTTNRPSSIVVVTTRNCRDWRQRRPTYVTASRTDREASAKPRRPRFRPDAQGGPHTEIGGTGHAQARPALYPTPRTVTTISGCSGSCSIFERSRCTWTLTSRVSPAWR